METANPKEEEEAAIASLSEAAKEMDPSPLATFLDQLLNEAWFHPELQILKLIDYYGIELSQVSSFQWVNLFQNYPLSKLIHVPFSLIPTPVYQKSLAFFNTLPLKTLRGLVLWASDLILSEWPRVVKVEQLNSDISKVATFVVLAMVLRAQPVALTLVLPELRESPTYQGQDKLPVLIWMMSQASQGDLPAGLYLWARNLLPLVVNNEECYSSHSIDLILQSVEMIFSSNPEARAILVNGAVRHGERLIPPCSFEMLVRLTFPPARVEGEEATTERFKAIYPLLKEVALAPDTNTSADALKQIFTFSLELAGGGQVNPALANEATAIAISVLTQNVDCFKQWDVLYKENLEASVALLKKLADEWDDHTHILSSDTLTVKHAMNSFRMKNEKAITEGVVANLSLYKEADQSCKLIARRLSRGPEIAPFTSMVIAVPLAAAGGVVVGASTRCIKILPADPKLTDKEEAAIASLSEAGKRIDPSHFAAFVDEVVGVPETDLLRFNYYLLEAFSQVSSLPWFNMLKKSPLSDVPLSHIPKSVYETAADWIIKLPFRTQWTFVVWAHDRLLIDWAAHARGEEQTYTKHQVATLVELAMVLRAKPDSLTCILPMLRWKPKYHGQDKLSLLVWMMTQAFQHDLPAGLYSWAFNLLPLIVNNEECYSSHSLDLILQFVEMILYSNPEARDVLLNEPVRHGERLIPPRSFEMLVRLTFPPARVEGEEATTERFKAIYPLLKEVALAPDTNTGADALKQIFTFSLELAGGGQGNPALANEATAIAISVLTQNVDCFKQWDVLYKENLEASVALLKKLADQGEDHTLKLLSSSPSDTLTVKHVMNSFRMKNEKAITEGVVANLSLYEEADQSCKLYLLRCKRYL